jgi:hypothetical protein
MLISMPTGTSTIFGVFQAILALLARPGDAALQITYCGKKSSPVKSLVVSQYLFMLQRKRKSHICAIRCQTNGGSTGSGWFALSRPWLPFEASATGFHIIARASQWLLDRSIQEEWFDSCRGIFSTPGSATN